MEKIKEILKSDNRYRMEAYIFVLDAVSYSQKLLPKKRHISGRELLSTLRKLGFRLYGKFTKEVFNSWGIHSTLDFGYIVFNLVDVGLLGKQPSDSLDDFRDVFDFDAGFSNYEIKVSE